MIVTDQNNERQLASIQRVLEIFPIEGADQIEAARVLGWVCVVKKGEFKVGDLGVYIEIDSILPKDKPEFAFMAPRGYRVKTVKLRGQVSQGLLLPISDISYVDLSDKVEDDDVTELLGVEKYDPQIPAHLAGKVRGNFPSFISKTDQKRIQSSPGTLRKFAGEKFYLTEKLDGSSFTCYLKDGTFGVCSRNLDLLYEEPLDGAEIKNAFWRAAVKLDLENKLRDLGKNIALQGELVGPGVQQNRYKLPELDVYFFDVYDITNSKYYEFDDFRALIEYFGLKTVPVVGEIIMDHSVDELVELAQEQSKIGKVTREGLVFKKAGDRVSFKVISQKYLLKYEE